MIEVNDSLTMFKMFCVLNNSYNIFKFMNGKRKEQHEDTWAALVAFNWSHGGRRTIMSTS
jgi:hypothetical protein